VDDEAGCRKKWEEACNAPFLNLDRSCDCIEGDCYEQADEDPRSCRFSLEGDYWEWHKPEQEGYWQWDEYEEDCATPLADSLAAEYPDYDACQPGWVPDCVVIFGQGVMWEDEDASASADDCPEPEEDTCIFWLEGGKGGCLDYCEQRGGECVSAIIATPEEPEKCDISQATASACDEDTIDTLQIICICLKTKTGH
jgi:hypothetical protein